LFILAAPSSGAPPNSAVAPARTLAVARIGLKCRSLNAVQQPGNLNHSRPAIEQTPVRKLLGGEQDHGIFHSSISSVITA